MICLKKYNICLNPHAPTAVLARSSCKFLIRIQRIRLVVPTARLNPWIRKIGDDEYKHFFSLIK